LKGDVLTFIRQKTKTTTTHTKEIKVHLHDEARRILNEIGTVNVKPDEYLFPWFNGCKNAAHHNDTYIRHKKVTNTSLKAIGLKLGLPFRLTIGLARHSFATKQKIDGTPVAFISEAMGHSSITVTERYLKALPDEHLRTLSANLLQFK
jgi:integrase/recombinase XerD